MTTASFDFRGQSVIVTGAAQGIGLAITTGFVNSGAEVFAVDRDPLLAETAGRVGAHPVTADVTNTSEVEAVVAQVVEKTGRVDVLVNNAGNLRDGWLWKLQDEDWDSVLDVHLKGSFRFLRACVPHFRAQKYGRVVNMTSYTGLHGNLGQSNYAAAKAGIVGLTYAAAKELAPFGITVNAVAPNAKTRMVESIPPERLKEIEATIPIGRLAETEEMFWPVAFLSSSEAGYITGAVLPSDGGMSI